MNTTEHENHGAVAGQVDCRVRPRAWMGVGCITGTPVFAMDDEPRSDACAPWLPLYELADANELVQQFVGEERDREADRWKWRVDGLTAQLREVDARYMALVKAVADGVALQPRPMMMLAQKPLTDDAALTAWNAVAPDGTNVGGGCSLDGWRRAVHWTEQMHGIGGLTPEFMQAQADEAPKLDLGA